CCCVLVWLCVCWHLLPQHMMAYSRHKLNPEFFMDNTSHHALVRPASVGDRTLFLSPTLSAHVHTDTHTDHTHTHTLTQTHRPTSLDNVVCFSHTLPIDP